MAISLSRYVNITSSVGSGTVVPTRLLVSRIFTGNTKLPQGSFLQFSNAADVGSYFGLTSEEYYRSLFYFGWVSKNQNSAPAIQFARWANAATAPQVFSLPNQATSLAAWTGISAGAFILDIGGVANTVSGLSFSGVTSFGDVAGIVQSGIQALYSIQQGGVLNSTITVTGLDDTSVLTVGMQVTGTGIQAGTTIATIVSGTSITLSLAATQTATQTLIFYNLANAMYVNATVVYQNNAFIFTGGVTGAATISIAPPETGTDITGAGLLGWFPQATYPGGIFSASVYANNAIWVNGSAIETITAMLTNTQAASNNFGSFMFQNKLALDLAQVQEAATWNAAAAQNNMYLYSIPVVAANAATWAAGLSTTPGCTMTLSQTPLVANGTLIASSFTVTGLTNATNLLQIGMPVVGSGIPAGTVISGITNNSTIVLSNQATVSATNSLIFYTVQFPEQCPTMIEAATNYADDNSVQNYMFQVFDPYLTPLVTSDSDASFYDDLSINYYGQTQTAGTSYNFYQRGLMFGTASTPTDQNTYVNEIWLKDVMAATLIALQLNLNQLPANAQGRALVLLAIQGVINEALNNGVISVGKTLTTAQQIYVGSVSNDPNAWYQVQNSGYWVDCVIQQIPNSSPVQYQANYTLIYSKDDVVRLIVGADILI